MRPQRNKKRARYAESSSSPSPEPEASPVVEAKLEEEEEEEELRVEEDEEQEQEEQSKEQGEEAMQPHTAKRQKKQQPYQSLAGNSQLQQMQHHQMQQQAMQFQNQNQQQQQQHIGGMHLALPQPVPSSIEGNEGLTQFTGQQQHLQPLSSSPGVFLQSSPPPQLQPMQSQQQQQPQQPQPQQQQQQLSKLRIANTTIEAAGITIPPSLPPSEYRRRRAQIQYELNRRRLEAPALPRSTIADLPPKPPAEPWVPFPDDGEDMTSDQERRIMERNNAIAADMQRVDRERNNAAAKKSRQKRLESLENTRRMLDNCYVEMCWWRMRAIAAGADGSEYLALPAGIKDGILDELRQDIKEKDDANELLRKEEESRRRTERNRNRAAQREQMRAQSGGI